MYLVSDIRIRGGFHVYLLRNLTNSDASSLRYITLPRFQRWHHIHCKDVKSCLSLWSADCLNLCVVWSMVTLTEQMSRTPRHATQAFLGHSSSGQLAPDISLKIGDLEEKTLGRPRRSTGQLDSV